jgi:hypothetical protein
MNERGGSPMSERNDRKTQVGRVVSDKMDKTIVVAVETYKNTIFTTRELNTLKNLKLMMIITMLKSVTLLKLWKLVLSPKTSAGD